MSQSAVSAIRTFLFAPGNHPRKVEKVFTAGADAVVLDLEDAVAVAEKVATRTVVVEALEGERSCLGYVRVNGYGTEYCFRDLDAVVGPRLDGIVLPKAERAAELEALDWMLSALEAERGLERGAIDLMPIVETARGIEALPELARATPRVRRLAFGAGDYTFDLDLVWTPEERALDHARAALVVHSRAAGLEPPIDTVVIHIRDAERLEASARRGREMGFQGKLCIHPDQVAPCNRVFSPSAEEIAHARRVVEAFQRAETEGSASIQLDGYFIDYPIVYKAERVLALAERLEQNGD